MKYRLGRLPHNPALLARLPQAAKHLDAIANDAQAGAPIDWTRDVAPGSWGMLLNDNLSDCTCAAVGHAVALWESYAPPVSFMTDDDVEGLYSAVSGYVHGNPATDHGARCTDVLGRWSGQGIECAGGVDHLSAFAVIQPSNHDHIRSALWALGCVYAGVTLHEANETEETWTDTASPVAGGHCVLLAGADDAGLTCVTWGELRHIAWSWWDACADEAYALLSPRWISAGRAPQGFPLDALLNDMRALS